MRGFECCSLVNNETPNYIQMFEKMLKDKVIKVEYVTKTSFAFTPGFFNLGEVNEEHADRFHQGIENMKTHTRTVGIFVYGLTSVGYNILGCQ